MDKKKLNKRLR